MYTVGEGNCTEEKYGIKLARMLGLPEDIIENSENYCTTITLEKQKKLAKAIREGMDKDNMRQRDVFKLAHRLLGLKHSSLSAAVLRSYLLQLRQQFTNVAIDVKQQTAEEGDDGTKHVEGTATNGNGKDGDQTQ